MKYQVNLKESVINVENVKFVHYSDSYIAFLDQSDKVLLCLMISELLYFKMTEDEKK